jgi:phosphonate transport system substrate-binding protein
MKTSASKRALLGLALGALFPLSGLAAAPAPAAAPAAASGEGKAYVFNVLTQRSVALTSQYWNPILTYASRKSGVPLELRLARTTKEANAAAEKGAYDFLYTNHFFTPERDSLGYRVIARPVGPGIRGQIIVPGDSPIQSLQELEGKDVAFPTPDAFASYWLTMDGLLRNKVNVRRVFAGNQEAATAQLRVNKVVAAGVADAIIERYAIREGFAYRVLWASELFNDLCIMVHPRVPKDKVDAVRAALIGMARDAEGRAVLQAGADLLKVKGEQGFVASDNKDYDNYRSFFKNTQVKASAN